MSKRLLSAALLGLLACLSFQVFAQSPVGPATRDAQLQALAERLEQQGVRDRIAAQAWANSVGLPLRQELPNGHVLELQHLAPDGMPVFYLTYNLDAADTVSTDEVWPGGTAGLNLDGAGMIIGQWDGGAVWADHPDFTGRLTQVDGATAVSNHATHVGGTLAGAGTWLLPEARGMAYSAFLDAYDWNSDTSEMAVAAASGLLVSNHSYGIAAGWIYIGSAPPNTWWWIGGPDPWDIEDPNFGYYDTITQQWDQIAHWAPYYLIVKAAGNDRSDTGPAPGEEYTVVDQDGSPLFTSTLSRPPDCAPAGYDCLPTTSVAKNVLTVGAVDDLPGGYSSLSGPSSVVMAPFSSWGPTDDGRIKPDVVGNGVFLVSTYAEYPYFAAAAGTSMAAPNVSGSLLLLQQHYENLHGPGSALRAASLKALAIHAADEAGPADGPDYAFGWGLLNTKKAAAVISGDGVDHEIIEGSLSDGSTQSHEISVSDPDATVTATLVWMDPPGTPPAPVLDPPDLMLVNDLDLRVHKGAATYQPWVLDPSAPANAATTGDNFRDNVEQVVVSGAGTGSYFVEVSHKGSLLNGVSQDYSLIVSIGTPPPTGSGFLIDEDFSGGLPPGWSVDTLSGVPWMIRTPVPGDARYDNQTGGSGNFAMVDNGYAYQTVTSLVMPEVDLGSALGAVLRFNSYYIYDTFESLNVDMSTDGGATWVEVWTFQGFNPLPTPYTLDLSGVAAGHSSVILRFRFDSEGWISGDLWQVDDVQLEAYGLEPGGEPPDPATNPGPSDGATDVGIDQDLSWTAGAGATSHDVYFGTASPLGAGDLQGNQAGTAFDPGTLSYTSTYYWRIDEVNADGTTTGSTWSFTTEDEPVGGGDTVHLIGLTGSATPPEKGRWTAMVEVAVEDDTGNPESGVTVEGSWSNGANGGGSCATTADGTCTVEKANLKQNVASVTFTVTNLAKAGMSYAPGDNAVSASVTVTPTEQNLTPNAVDDSYQTDVDTPLVGNVMDNDDPGDGPAAIAGNSLPASGSLSLAGDGAFTYTPDAAFEGADSFTYSIQDSNGDVSNVATVAITVGGGGTGGDPTVTASPYKEKGVQHVALTWVNFSGASVDIRRDETPLPGSPTANDGAYDDNIGVKGGGVSYTYEVCEEGTANCASAVANF